MIRKLHFDGVAGGDGIVNGAHSFFNRFYGTVLLFVIMMMNGGVFGQTSTLQLATGSGNMFGTTSGSTKASTSGTAVTWTATSTSGAIQNSWNTSYLGQQFGTGSSAWTGTFTAPAISGATITQIDIRANTGGSATLAASVGGTAFSPSSQSVTRLTSATNTTLPTYTFTGSNTGAITITVSGTSSAFYLNRIIVTYTTGNTVTFDGNGATGGSTANQTASTSTNLTANGFTRTGYTFANWHTTASGTGGTTYSDGQNYAFGANITLYAQWTPVYTLTYNGNSNTGGTVPTDSNSPYTATSTVTVLGNTGSLVKTNYNFSGWNTAADGTGTDRAAASTFSMPASNTILYAKWTGNVSYNANGGTGTVTDATNYLEGQSVTTASGAGFTRAGYAFIGWNALANGLGTSYTASQVSAFNFAGNTTLYAVWNPVGSHTVIFEANGGTGTMANQVESSATALTANSFNRAGYTFANWNTAANGSGTTYTNGQSYPFASNITLYAQWTANNNTVTFDANTGTGTMTAQTIATDATAALNANTFAKAGYTFSGWATTAGGAVAYANSASYTMGTSNVTLYAKWTANNNTITFNSNGAGATGTMANQTIATDASAALTTNTFARSGFTFAGWATSAASVVADYADGATYNMGTSNVTLYAVWDVYTGPCGSETFSNATISTSYGSGSYTGDNGVTWSYTASRDEDTFGITGKGIMLRRSSDNSNITSAAVPGGIGDFTCKLRKAFTASSNRQVQLFVNGTPQTASIAWDNTNVQTYTVTGINISGNVTIEIRNITANQVIVDDISWTCYSDCSTPANPNGTIAATQNCGYTSLAYTHGSGQPVAGVSYYWQTSATGTDTTHPTSIPFLFSIGATYHVRAKSTVGDCWSAGTVSQAVTVVTAQAITTEPANQSAPAGTTATFTVVATNATNYQWQVNTGSGWNNVSTGTGGTTASYTTPTTTLAMSGYQYKVIVSGTSPCFAIESAVRTLTVTPVVTWANLQWPPTHTMEEGSTFDVYGRVFADGVTNSPGQGAGLTAEIGYRSTTNSDPSLGSWTWVAATYFGDDGANNDEYRGTLGTAMAPGTYYYATRFRVGTGAYVYGDTAGVWSSTANNGVLTITSNLVDWGNYHHPPTGSIVLGDTYNVYGRAYEAGNTNVNSPGTNITAEVGYSTTNSNPSTWSNWFSANFNIDAGNDDEYMHNIGANFPSNGTYYMAFRYRKTGSTQYVYGGTGGVWNNDNASVVVTAPKEINIQQGATNIASGGTFGFGNQVSSTSSAITTFTIQNTGGVVLNLTGSPRVVISGTNASEFTINQASLPATVAGGGSETFTVTFTPNSLGAKTAQLSIANDDSNENPYLINLTGTGTASATSNIITNTAFAYGPINYLNYINSNITVANSVELGQFIIQDGGGASDADNLATTLSALSLTIGNVANLERLAIYDGATEIAEVAASATTNFTGLTALTAADGGTKTFSIRGSFKTAVTDNQRITLTIASATAANTGSTFGTITAATSTTGTDNVIQVTADRLAFVQQPSNTAINFAMTPAVTVSANDINGNRDLDFTGSVEIISDGTLTGGSTTTVNAVSGVATFSNLVHSATGTGLQLLAGHTSWTTPVSNVFAITTIVFLTNDYRTTGTGNWVSNNASPAIWERLDSGGNWNTSNSPSYSTTNNVYIRNGHTVTATGSFGSTVKLKIMDGGTFDMTSSGTAASIYVYDGGELRINAALTVVGAFDVENNADVYLNNAFGNPGTTIWAGTENFRPQSNFYIWNWNSNQYFYNNNITANSNGTIFGNLHFDTTGGAGITGNWNLLSPSTGTITLTSGDLIFDSGQNNIRFFAETGSTANVTIKGNLKLNSGWSRILALSTAGTMNLTVDGNVEIDSPGALAVKQANSAASAATLTIKGDLLMNGANTTSSTNLHLNANSSASGGGKAILDLKGNLAVGTNATIVNSVGTADVEFNFSGTTLQLINVGSTVSGSNTDNSRGIPFYVKANASVQLNTNDLTLANGSRFIVETGGTLDFGFTGSTPRVIKHGATGNSAFTSQAGSILKITSDAGINSTGSTGNVQVTAANRTFTALGDFHYIGKIGQATGNGLPTNVRNLVVHNEGASNNLTLSNTSVHVNGELSMIQGNIVSTTSNLLTIGASASTPGTLNYTSGVVKGTGGTIGTMRRYFAGTNTADATGLFPLGTTANEKRFIRTEFTGTNGGYLDATFVVADMGDNGLLALSSIPAVGSCAGFTVLNTDEDLFWRVTPEAGTLTNGTHRVTLTKDDTSDICKQTVLKRETTSSDWLNPGTHLAGIVNSGNHIVSRQAMNGPLKDFGIGDGSCSGTPVVYNGGAWPATTRLTPIVINADVTLPAGITEACECLVSDNVTLTVPSNATLQIVNGITIEAGTNPNGSEDGNLIIENNGSLIQITDVDNATANNNTGKINMERISKPMYRYDFTYWSSPLFANDDPDDDEDAVEDGTEFNLKQLSPMTFFDKYYKWGHAGAGWITIPVGVESMVPGRGYIVRAPQNYATDATNPASYQPYTANFIGKPNNGTIRHAVSGGADQWNLLGNPYPSAISADSFFDANVGSANGSTNTLEGTIYLWTHNTKITPTGTPHIYSYSAGDYAAYNGTGSTNTKEAESDPTPDDEEDNLPTGFIAAGQSFFIKGTAAGQAVFNNSMRIAGNNNQFFRPASTEPLNNWDMTGKHRVWLNMKGQIKGFSQLLVGYVPNATNDLDIRFDGESFGGNQVTFYSLLADKKLTIQGRALPFNNQDEVPLGYKSTLNGTLTISLDQYDGLFEGQGIYLEDKLLNIVHDLKASNYSFASTIGTFNQRFVLRYVPSSELSNPDHEAIANGLILYQEDGKIMIKSQLEDISQVMVYDLLGRIVFDQNSIAKRDFSIQNVVMNEQPLIVKVKLANGQIVNKKIVH